MSDNADPNGTRTYQFVITFEVEPDHPAYDDPEWAADAAHGALTNEHGLRAIYTEIAEVTGAACYKPLTARRPYDHQLARFRQQLAEGSTAPADDEGAAGGGAGTCGAQVWDLTDCRSNEMIRAVVPEPEADDEAVAKRGRGRPRKWASDAERVRAWRAAERVSRSCGRVSSTSRGWSPRSRTSRPNATACGSRCSPQAQVRALEQSPTPGAPPPAESASAVIRWQQQADDLASILARLTGLGWDHPMFALVDRRARTSRRRRLRSGTSVFDDPEAGQAFVRPEPPPLPSSRPTPESSRLSHAERRRLEREAKRRGRS